ncbi:universal stress protein [Muriicola sp. Z0-33]|uniref:universal stress protein n=1 Tax=Muriicola sp. Z0-33 TaxID=2816957 RepID=UPI0022378128|nr:universal stress protein [Muriicola sp. Z0-33]MCW5515765.1 universal stress protein [Muriicola sp. Z0-33]
MENRVLLPTDYSKGSVNAIKYAINLYKDVRSKFYLLNAFHASGYSLDSLMVAEAGERRYEAAKLKSREGMANVMAAIEGLPKNPKHSFETICSFNNLLLSIEEVLKAKDIDIIVMGTKGITDDSNSVFGTNAVGVMEKITQCPVIAIPGEMSFKTPSEIIFPTDYKTAFRRKELNYMIDIAKLHGSAIRVLHIEKESKLNRGQQNNKALLEEMLEGIQFSFHTLKNVNVSHGVQVFIESRGSDMVAFQNRKHRFFNSILSNPLVKELGYYSNIPILVLKDQS